MISLKNLKPHLFYTLLKHQKPSFFTQPSFSTNTQCLVSPEMVKREINNNDKNTPLDILFKGAVGLSEKLVEEEENENEKGFSSIKLKELHDLKSKLRKIEREVRSMKGNNVKETEETKAKKKEVVMVEPKRVNLYSVFTKNVNCKKKEKDGSERERELRSMKGNAKDTEEKKAKKKEVVMVESKGVSLYSVFTSNVDCEKKEEDESEMELKPTMEFSTEMILFVKKLHEKGYLKGANFLPSNKLDFSCFWTLYSRGYLRVAAERFGKDHPEMATSLSETDMKRLALFGCPGATKKTAFAAKRLRSYFSIQEDIVCRPCKLNSLCKSKYHTVGKKADDLNIVDVMRIITLYASELVPPELTIPDEIKDSINRLLKQAAEHS